MVLDVLFLPKKLIPVIELTVSSYRNPITHIRVFSGNRSEALKLCCEIA